MVDSLRNFSETLSCAPIKPRMGSKHHDMYLFAQATCALGQGTIGLFSLGIDIRQGEPISPYICVMKRLGHLINHAVNNREWKPVKLSRNEQELSHLFFADDQVLFVEASEDQLRVILDYLYTFSQCSGEKINSQKSKIYFSKNIDKKLANIVG